MVDFRKIRTIGTNQENGFEEFVCQLARKEKIENAKRFVKLGNPDGGLECYWELEDGSKIGWQAKYFTSSLSYYNRWEQIENSIKSALNNHDPKKIIIAIPYDPGIIGGKNLQNHIDKWKNLPESKDKEFEIEFWLEHDLILRLQKPENEGFVKFWFDETYFTDDWFNNHVKTTIENLGDKLDRIVQINTNNKIYFDSICRNKDFEDYIYNLMHGPIVYLKKQLKSLIIFFESKNIDSKIISDCLELMNKIQKFILSFDYDGMDNFDFETIQETLNKIIIKIQSINLTFINEKDKKRYSNYYNNIYLSIEELDENINDDEILKITNNPSILFYGEAGIGKSFLFGDTAEKKLENNENLIFLLGEQFGLMSNPENIILNELTISGHSFDDFLDALECKAYSNKSRMIILIDAINEGKGIELWNIYLRGLIEKISNRESLAIVLSIRDTFINKNNENDYSKLQIPYNNINAIELTGFKDIFSAKMEYFKKYNIKFPNNYMLSPELDNPLFLKLFCESLYNKGYEIIPNNLEGFSKIMEFYIDSINTKLAKKLKYHPKINLINDILNGLIKFQIENNKSVTIKAANSIIMDCASNYPFKHEILKELINEGLLHENNFINDSYIQITFQRLKDYTSVKYLMNNLSFNEVIDYLSNMIHNSKNNLLEMFSIYIPENYNVELYELLDDTLIDNENVISCFIKSLKWRRANLDEKIFDYINNHVINTNLRNEFLKALIDISTIENHLLNAYRTHNILSSQNLPTRDAFWTTFLHYTFRHNSNINHLLDFGLIEDYSNYTDESIKLSAIMITWFLATTNCELRDKSTFALTNILKNKLNIVKDILELFKCVDDPWILERLYVSAYGCVLVSDDLEHLNELSDFVYETIFNQNKVYPHILLRDYARNIIEFALTKDCELKEDKETIKENIKPPYQSDFPEIVSDEKLMQYESENPAVKKIFQSMKVEFDKNGKKQSYGDFGRYVFQHYFNMWDEVSTDNIISIADLENIAIDKIFKLGYNEKKHAKFDEYILNIYYDNDKIERIGKKYQWIAFYELMAQFGDKYPLLNPDSVYFDIDEKIEYESPLQLDLRNIDPTIIFKKQSPPINLSIPNYNENNYLKENWINSITDLPNPLSIINCLIKEDDKETKGLILDGFLNWETPTVLGEENYPKKEIYYLINSYIIPNNNYKNLIRILKHCDLNGRWMPEPKENDQLFNKEYYNSKIFKDMNQTNNLEKTDIKLDNKTFELILPTTIYLKSERSKMIKNNYSKLSNSLFNGLNLKYEDYNTFNYDNENNLISFDTIELEGFRENNSIIRKKELLNYLNENNLNIFFTVLGEKRILDYENSAHQSFSGVYYFKNNELKGNLKQYTDYLLNNINCSFSGIVHEKTGIKFEDYETSCYFDEENKISYLFFKSEKLDFINKDTKINTKTFENYEWDIYGFDEKIINTDYSDFLNENNLNGDGYILTTPLRDDYQIILINSCFDIKNNLNSKLFQKYIKSLLLNINL